MQRIADETGAAIGGTLYGDALSPAGGEADNYIKMLRHDVNTLKAGMLSNCAMLLIAAWRRLLVAGVGVAGLWAAVLWVAPSTPSTGPAQPSVQVAAQPTVVPVTKEDALRAVVRSGVAAPGGGRFDRFEVTSQPIV